MKIENDEIYREWKKWEASSPVVEERQPSERFGELLLEIAENLLLSPRFVGYGWEDKEEMVADAVLKMLKNIKNIREDKKNSLFSYLTMCAYCAYVTYLRKKNRRMKFMEDYKADVAAHRKVHDFYRTLEEEYKQYTEGEFD